jgi:hypothetical protein
LLFAGWAAACSRDDHQREASPEPVRAGPDTQSTVSPADTGGTWTSKVEQEMSADAASGVVVLLDARTAVHAGFDRIVFEFSAALPGYRIDYLRDTPTHCGSGEVVDLPGDARLTIRLYPAQAHTDEGVPTVAQRDQSFRDRNLKRIKLICDFEAVVEWVVAMDEPQPFRVLELKAPDRLVIDVRKGE